MHDSYFDIGIAENNLQFIHSREITKKKYITLQ